MPEDIFPEAPPEEVQRRSIIFVRDLLSQVHDKLSDPLSIVPGKLSTINAEEIKKDLAEINARIEQLKQKIG